MIWTPEGPPQSGLGNVCMGIDAYQKSRPPPSIAYLAVSWTLFGIAIFALVSGTLAKAYYRNDPRFRVVRPFYLSVVSLVCLGAWSIAMTLNIATPDRFPCSLFVLFVVFGIAGLGVGFSLRLLNYVVRSQYELASSRYRMRMAGSTSPQQEEPEPQTVYEDSTKPSPSIPMLVGTRDREGLTSGNLLDQTVRDLESGLLGGSTQPNNQDSDQLLLTLNGDGRDSDLSVTQVPEGGGAEEEQPHRPSILSQTNLDSDQTVTTAGGSSGVLDVNGHDHPQDTGHARQKLAMIGETSDSIIVARNDSLIPKIQPTSWGGKACICQALASLVQVTLGCKRLEDVPFEELVLAKRAPMILVVAVVTPSIIVLVVLFIVVPQYRYCVGCAWFVEIMIGVLVAALPYIIVSSRMLYIAKKEQFPDRQGIFFESLMVLTIPVPLMFVWIVLMIIDPANAELNRLFAYEWISMVGTFIFFYFTSIMQIFKAFQQRQELNQAKRWWQSQQNMAIQLHPSRGSIPRTSTISVASQQSTGSQLNNNHHHKTNNSGGGMRGFYFHRHSSITSTPPITTLPEDFLDQMDHDEVLKEEFTEFAISRYAVENLHFVNDARAFKRFFEEKAATWRRQKAMFLYETYIKLNSPMEVNISDATRKGITAQVQSGNLTRRQLETAFDPAINDISNNVLRQMWVEFQHERRSRRRRRKNSGSPRHSNTARTNQQQTHQPNQLHPESPTLPSQQQQQQKHPRPSSGDVFVSNRVRRWPFSAEEAG